MSKFQFLNIEIDNVTFDGFLTNLKSGLVVTPNADHLMKLQKDKAFYDVYQTAEHVVCDSRILYWLSKILEPKQPIKEQIAGSDLFPAYCAFHKNNTDNIKIFLLGGTETSVEAAKNNINERTDSDVVTACYSPPFGFQNDDTENQKIIDLISESGATVLAVGVGAPKQEFWLAKNRHKLPGVHTFFAIGASIEFESGCLARAPKWMTKCGLEWLFRISQEPKRMAKRYFIDDLGIFYLCLKQKLGLYRDPFEQSRQERTQ